MPSEADAQKIFDDVLKTSFKDNMIALSTRLKKDDAFKVKAPLSNTSATGADLAVGNQEDIRIDHPFIIRRSVDGESKEVAFMKVREVGDTCLAIDASKRTTTHAAIITGSVEDADMAFEHPWTGIFGNVYAKHLFSTFSYNDEDTGGGALSALGLGFNADLGYILNKKELSEVWLDTSVYLGVGSEGTMRVPFYAKTTTGSFAIGLAASAQKRFYLFSGIFVAPALDANFEAQSFSMGTTYWGDPISLGIATLSIEPKVKAGINFGPNIDVNGYIGSDLPLMTSASYKVGDSDSVPLEGYSKSSGLSVGVSVNIHSDFAGPFAKMYKKPSSRCDALRKE